MHIDDKSSIWTDYSEKSKLGSKNKGKAKTNKDFSKKNNSKKEESHKRSVNQKIAKRNENRTSNASLYTKGKGKHY